MLVRNYLLTFDLAFSDKPKGEAVTIRPPIKHITQDFQSLI